MTGAGWQPEWLETARRPVAHATVWRGVESQHASATTLLVDGLDAHDVLERMLEDSKPPPPALPQPKHYLLTTPFRYMPAHASRFRQAGGRGAWYGAVALQAACAEVAHWRMRFIQDSAGLAQRKLITHHTFFAAAVHGPGIDLMQPPWASQRADWTSDDYAHTHRLARAAQVSGIEVIQYESARAPGSACVAVFSPGALSEPAGGLDATRQQWVCTATASQVMLRSQADAAQRYEWHA